MEFEKTAKATQEQAVASWINYLNQVRLDRLMETLNQENNNLENAMSTIKDTLETISKDIVNNGSGRGGIYGMHGFIAEVAECGVGNARSQIEGKMPIYEWINDNGPEDLRRGGILIQQKFVNSGHHFSLQAIKEHLEKYPDFINNGGVYQIPSDHYDSVKELLLMPEEEANRLARSTGKYTLRQWKEVHGFFDNGDVSIESIEPSTMKYGDVQVGTYENSLEVEKESLLKRNEERRNQAYQESKPSFEQGLKATAVSAAVEGGMTFCMSIVRKRKEGKAFKDFSEADWKDIAGETGVGIAKGGIRGLSIYVLTNYTATPAAVASALVTASFGVAEQAHLYRNGQLDETTFLVNSETLCMDAAISALSSLAGQVLIPVPVIGAVIGNAIGTMLYQIARDNLSAKEQKLIEGYIESIGELEDSLRSKYKDFLNELSEDMKVYMEILGRAFAPDIRFAFSGSIELARQMGVPAEEILDSKEKVLSYFMG